MQPHLTALTLLTAASIAAPALAEPLSLDAVLSASVEHDRRIVAAGLEAEAREADARAVGRRLLPVLKAEANAFVWDSAFDYEFDFTPLGQAFGPLLPPGTQLDLPALDLRVRDQFVFTFQATIAQPLSQLYRIYRGSQAKDKMVEAAQADVDRKRLDVQGEAVEAYFNHLAALRARDTLNKALEQVDAYEKKTKSYLEAELIEKDALLKVQVQRRQLERARIEVDKGVALTASMLNMLMGRPLDTPVELTCGTATTSVALASCTRSATSDLGADDLAAWQDEAVTARPELRSARAQQAAADLGKKATYGELWPDVTALVAYQNNQGTGEFVPENAVFGGVALTWNVFEWGATKAKYDAMKARAAQAEAMVAHAEDGIRLHVQQKRLELEGARAEIEVAQAGLELAQENLRLEQARYDAQTTAATDLLAAQTSVVEAENALDRALLQKQAKQLELRLAAGRDLTADAED